MTESPSIVFPVALWALLGGYLIVWTIRSFRSILAVFAGAMVSLILASLAGEIVTYCFGFVYGAMGVPANEILPKLGHSVAFWLTCFTLGILYSYFVGFISGMAAGHYEMFHACLATVIGLGLTPILPPELDLVRKLGSGSACCIVLVLNASCVAMTMWGGRMAKRGKERAEVALKRGGSKLREGQRTV